MALYQNSVLQKYLATQDAEQLKSGEFIGPECKHYLSNRKEFELDKDTIIAFCQMAVKFFEGV